MRKVKKRLSNQDIREIMNDKAREYERFILSWGGFLLTWKKRRHDEKMKHNYIEEEKDNG